MLVWNNERLCQWTPRKGLIKGSAILHCGQLTLLIISPGIINVPINHERQNTRNTSNLITGRIPLLRINAAIAVLKLSQGLAWGLIYPIRPIRFNFYSFFLGFLNSNQSARYYNILPWAQLTNSSGALITHRLTGPAPFAELTLLLGFNNTESKLTDTLARSTTLVC